MIEFWILSLMILLSISILITGFVKKQYTLVIFSGILFLVVSAFFLNGISYVSGVVIDELNGTSTMVTDVTSTYDNNFSIGFSLGIGLLGLFFLIAGIILAFSKPDPNKNLELDE